MGDQGRRLAHEKRASGELASRWFEHIAGDTAKGAHHGVAILRQEATCEWLVVRAPQKVPAQLPDFPGRPRETRTPTRGERVGLALAGLAMEKGRQARRKP
jgi:hypothetical protein